MGVYLMAGKSYYHLEELELAKSSLQLALKDACCQAESNLYLGHIAYLRKDHPRAIKHY
jgi:hypothetical protein